MTYGTDRSCALATLLEGNVGAGAALSRIVTSALSSFAALVVVVVLVVVGAGGVLLITGAGPPI